VAGDPVARARLVPTGSRFAHRWEDRRVSRRNLALAISLALAGLLLAGCTSGTAQEPGKGSRPTVGEERAPLDYVALGDSYTAGPLISTVRSDPSACGRSTNNYPAFLAGWLGVRSYTDVSCSGATTAHLTRPQPLYGGGAAPPQLDALSGRTDLVTVGLGGNDFGIFARLSSCAGAASPGSGARACPDDLGALARDAARVRARLADGLRRVEARAPRARVLVVGYPRVLPDSGTCPALGVDPARAAEARRVVTRLEASVRGAADDADATYVDLTGPTAGHDVCAGPRAWIQGARFGPGGAPLHPLLPGMRGIAAAVHVALTGDEPPRPADGDGAGPGGELADPPRDAVVRNEPLPDRGRPAG
jgi:lysophospholipase L1-like esterase